MPLIRSISGLRGTIPDSLNSNVIKQYAFAFHKLLGQGNIMIGRDGRPSGKEIERTLCTTFSSLGREVCLFGVIPTPTVQLLTEKLKAAGGIAITASHNPEEWNGLKFINKDGTFLDGDENNSLWNYLDEYDSESKPIGFASVDRIDKAYNKHIESILRLPIFTENDDLKKIKKRKLFVVVDAVNASGSKVVPQLLKALGCRVYELHCNGTGIFPHTPEPVAENLNSLCQNVKKYKADLGIAVDPDADRLVLIDDRGEPTSEENTIVLAVESVLQNFDLFKGYSKAVVVNHSTTMAVEDIAAKYGAKVIRSAVGEINVVKMMKKTNAIIGGEGSGGVILPACHYGRDSLAGIALILTLLARQDSSLSIYLSTLPKYEMVKRKKEFEGDFNSILNKIKEKFSGEYIEDDGIKIITNDGWIQLRKSNTEPIIRFIVEARDKHTAMKLIDEIEKLL